LQESLAWDFRLLDGERTVYHWGPGDHGRARFPAEAAARLSSQLDQQGLQWNATSAAAWRDVCSKWRTAAVTAETSDNESARVLNDPDDPAATGAPFGSLVDALLEGFAHRAPPHRGTPFAPRAQLVAARYRPVADARLQYAPTRPPTAFWREVVARRARPGSPFSVSTYAGDATDQALTAALGAGGGHRLRRITLASPQPVGRPTRRASPGRARP
jgi:hypothetical protein